MPPISRARGTRDILPADQARWRQVEECAGRSSALFGFRRLDTPVIEPVELYRRGVGEATDIVEKEMYAFMDRGGRELVLRPEGTAGAVRAYFENGFRQEQQPVRLFTTGPFFRYDRPQAGRYRQFHQFSAEIIGDDAPGYDVEVIALLWDWLGRVGLGPGLSLQLNSIGDSACRPAFRQALVNYYTPLRDQLCEKCRRRLEVNPLRLLDCKERGCLVLMEGAPRAVDHLCEPCADHFAEVKRGLDRIGIQSQLNHRLVRGLDYYTRTTFEIWHSSLGGAQNALGGGGRYDGLAESLGFPATAGVGFGSGLERVAAVADSENLPAVAVSAPLVTVLVVEDALLPEAAAIGWRLRQAGIAASVDGSRRSFKARLRAAQRSGVARVLILGPEDLAAGRLTLKDMVGEEGETAMSFGDVVSRLSAPA